MKVGLLSDTHGHLDPRIPELFRGVDHILHAGDIGHDGIIADLSLVAPVTAVLGNNDIGMHYRETEVVELAGRRFLVHHIVQPTRLHDRLARSVAHHRPEFLVFGHTHLRHDSVVDGVRFLNPGYCGRPRFAQDRSVAVLELGTDEAILTWHLLGNP